METILWSSAENMDQLMSKEFRGKECILIENVIHTKLDYVPLAVKYLTIRSCNLLSLKGMHLPNLEYLDVSNNPLYSLCEISTTKLVTLIISNTSVADIAPVAAIKTLKHFRAENCFIVNFLPLIQHFNFTVQWLSAQFVPDQKHFQMLLNPKEDENEAEKIMSALLEFKNESDYTVKMILRYANVVENGELKVENDEEITNFRFTDYINAFKAMFDKCCNIGFENTPKKLKELSITNSHLTSVEGVQNMTELELVNFNSNDLLQLWEVELLFLVYYVSNYILKYFATSNADDKFQQIISSWRLFMNYSLTQEGQKYDFDRIRPQSTIQSRYLIFQKGKIEITTCNKGRQ
ncbi:Leucine-rich_repeat domain superfamily [Hexamita inflata]|uniref:Leucine-rich repeat domain superfamily n=1 Tax=Hexamita inflata TaxID=28002 RepID=A0AA86PZH2_9EUKA|nr:Leucine-rich repeat domain superfamily [Hexamita inflata]